MFARTVVFIAACLAVVGASPAVGVPPRVKWSSDAVRWAPALLHVADRGHKTIRKVRVRVYAEADYRASVTRWPERARAMLDDLNLLAGPTFGVRFEVESLRRWEGTPRGMSADKALALLESMDPGEDVDWVVGFIAPLPLLTTSIHEIGMARDLGHHFVLRAMADLEEARSIKTLDLSSDEEAKLYTVRKWHKEISVFLHEWGHTLGAIHSSDEINVMNPTYSHLVSVFSAEQMRAMDVALTCRLGHPAVPAWRCRPLLTYLEKTNRSDWYTRDRQLSIEALRAGLAGGPPGKAAESSTGGPALTTAQAQAWNTALARLSEAHEAEKTGELAQAMQSMARAAEQAQVLAAAGAPVWLAIARQYYSLGALSRAADALDRAGTDAEVATARSDLQQSQRHYGLPAPRSVAVDAEPEYVRAFAGLVKAVTGSSGDAVAQALKAYPEAPGLMMISCEAHLRAGRERQAEKACTAALDGAPELARAHYLLGLLSSGPRRSSEAVAHLRKAIDLEPQSPHHWEALGTIYRMTRKRQELRELSDEYGKRFGRKLP